MRLKLILSDLKYELKSTVFTLICAALSSVMTSFIFASVLALCRAELRTGPDAATAAGVVFTSAFIALSVTAAGCFMIYSAVSVSFERRLRLLGALSSLGATEGQKAVLLLSQAGIYGVFGALAGSFAGGAAADALLEALKNGVPEFSGYDLHRTFPDAAASFIFCFSAVIAASLKPALRMKKINIIDIEKGGTSVNIALKDGIFTVIAEKLFGYHGRLAGQFYENDRKKYRAATAALAFSEGFFFFFRSFFEYEKQSGGTGADGTGLLIVYAICAPVLILCAAASFSVFISAFESNKRGAALLFSLGARARDILRIYFIESLYFFCFAVLFTLLSTSVGSYAMLTFERLSDPGAVYTFTYPLTAYLPCLTANALLSAALLLYNVAKAKKLDMIRLIRDAE